MQSIILNMKILLQHKIVTGYLLLMVVIACMVAIVLHERKRVVEIEQESITIFQTQSNITTTHRYITVLATLGESVMMWNDEDCDIYHTRRLKADSLLQILREQCKEFVRPEQVDSLRTLNKEEHLFQMNRIYREQKHIDSLLANQYSLVTSQANEPRTITRKKKGIAGWFGGKETVQLPSANTRMKARGNELISLQEERKRNIETYTDSLRLHNRELNQKLRSLLISLDEQALLALQNKEIRLKDSYEHSTLVITGLIIFSIILLIVSYLIIQRDIREKARNKERLEETIGQNTALLEMRKKLGLYANLRPVSTFKSLVHRSPLRQELVEGADFICIRELTGGIYFGQPQGRSEDGQTAFDSCVYTKAEIKRICRLGFEYAMKRRNKLTVVDKANVLATSRLWRETVQEMAPAYPQVNVEYMTSSLQKTCSAISSPTKPVSSQAH